MNIRLNRKTDIRNAIAGLVFFFFFYSFINCAYADMISDDEKLAKKFAPILVLTKNPTKDYIVLNPEPVEIVGANNITNLWFAAYDLYGSLVDTASFGDVNWRPEIDDSVYFIGNSDFPEANINFVKNKFAFLSSLKTSTYWKGTTPNGSSGVLSNGSSAPLLLRPYFFNYPGDDKASWNTTYLGTSEDDSHAGWRFPNTVYARIFERSDSSDGYGSVVIKYFCFYPYNDWINNHEGDWPTVNVIVTNKDPDLAELYGINYTFHGKSLTYYNSEITDSLSSINIRQKVTPVGEKHPVVYVSAGGHGHFPTSGHYINAGEALTDENLTPHGIVLHPDIVDSNEEIAQSYNIVLLPDPVNTLDNMGLSPEMSWLGANIIWGTPEVSTPLDGTGLFSGFLEGLVPDLPDLPGLDIIQENFGNDAPAGPFHTGWSTISKTSSYPKSRIPYTSFHNFPIVGNITWSGTVSLRGDIVVFPGATLTIESGTIIEFEPRTDIHKFPAQGHGVDNRAEIFVYGTLNAEGTSTSPIRFRRKSGTPAQAGYAWGGIRIMEGGSVDLDHTTIRNMPLPPPPTGLTAQAGTGQATLRWDA